MSDLVDDWRKVGVRQTKSRNPYMSGIDMEKQHGGGQVAVRQERWQYVGIAGSQFNSYASILPPLQFQVIGAIPCLSGCFTFPQSLLPPKGGKTQLVKNTGFSLKEQRSLP